MFVRFYSYCLVESSIVYNFLDNTLFYLTNNLGLINTLYCQIQGFFVAFSGAKFIKPCLFPFRYP